MGFNEVQLDVSLQVGTVTGFTRLTVSIPVPERAFAACTWSCVFTRGQRRHEQPQQPRHLPPPNQHNTPSCH